MPSVECPECGEDVAVDTTDESRSPAEHDSPSERDDSAPLQAAVVSWRELEPRHPYPGGTSKSPSEIDRLVQRLEVTLDVNGERVTFECFHKPEVDSDFWTHVVRADTDAGRKNKNALVVDDGDLYVKNKGIHWDDDKDWTFLSKPQLRERSAIAGLGDVVEVPDTRGGLGVLLDERYRPLISEGILQEDLVCKLAKALLVFQSEENPIA